MSLNDCRSVCEPHQRIIVSRDHRSNSKHIANNVNQNTVKQYRIDGDVIKDHVRCDFLVVNDDKHNAYLIELKGTDIKHAISQLDNTYQQLKEDLKMYSIKYRIVYSAARTHSIMSNEFKKFKHAHAKNGEFLYHENELKEDI